MKKHFIKSGDRFGRLVVLSEESRRDCHGFMRRYAVVHCDCGNEVEVMVSNLVKKNHTTSCGCAASENAYKRMLTHGHSCTCGGRHRARTYRAWEAAKQRCFNPNNKDYKDYGNRGISMYPGWKDSFETFLRDMGECPQNRYIDRIDNNGNYTPGNCRWATAMEQAYNRRCSKRVLYHGKKYTLRELSDMTGIKYSTLERRIHNGWSIEETVEIPLFQKRSSMLVEK